MIGYRNKQRYQAGGLLPCCLACGLNLPFELLSYDKESHRRQSRHDKTQNTFMIYPLQLTSFI
jgi:hypothetical protein